MFRHKRVSGALGYQVRVYKTKKNAKKNKKALVTKIFNGTKVKFTIKSKKLKGKKTVYVRARGFAVDGSKRIFGAWSNIKKVKAK